MVRVQIAVFQSINVPVNSKVIVLDSLDLKMLEVKFQQLWAAWLLECEYSLIPLGVLESY